MFLKSIVHFDNYRFTCSCPLERRRRNLDASSVSAMSEVRFNKRHVRSRQQLRYQLGMSLTQPLAAPNFNHFSSKVDTDIRVLDSSKVHRSLTLGRSMTCVGPTREPTI